MKKILTLVVLTLVSLCLLASCGIIDSILFREGLYFTSNDDGTCYVMGIDGFTDTNIEIPFTSPDGDRVTSIGEGAFYGCTGLKDVYYTGGEDAWKAITIGSSNSKLTSAKRHYNYVPEN